ncbi:TerB family tellurite resistance protein [filamentous cyanobacterium LEGE 11480]|uniref:TerB family tellurite resistance protein n=1 Tax=Romeriopsis navalis LEGE 11480 TaxID=2777977 RepID=A0A928VJB4_9CYAN|nr:TerB family tellurite resistance protein [Romeriopsis navalis LEGE 11480]
MKASNHSIQNLLKILIGAAWIDGKVQREEQTYLYELAKQNGVADDPEIYPLLHGLRKINTQQCYKAIHAYLGDKPSHADCQELLEAISGLIYSDGTVGIEEAKLLTKIQEIEVTCDVSGICSNNMPDLIYTLYQRWVAVLDKQLPS